MLAASKTTDVIVVGGGIVGLSIAYNLAIHEAIKNVTLIERRELGGSMVPNSIASVEPFSMFPPVATLHSYSIGIYTGARDTARLDLGYTLAPMMLLVGEEDVPALKNIVDVCKTAGSHIIELTPEECTLRFPAANLEGIAAAAYSEDSGYINPARAIRQYAAAAERHRVKTLVGTSVEGLITSGGRVTGVETSDGPYYADAVVLATGGWTGRFLEKIGLTNPLVDRVHMMGSLQMPPDDTNRLFNYSVRDMKSAFYLYPGGMGRYIYGSHLWPDTLPVNDPDSYSEVKEAKVLDRAYERIVNRFPVFAEATRQDTWSILWDVSPDKQPLMGPVSGYNGLFMAAGSSGMGYKLAPAIGASMPGIITGEAEIIRLFEALQPRRIEDNHLLIPEQPFYIHKQ